MMIIPKKIDRFYYLGYPKIVALITSGRYDNANIMPASWNTPVSFDPPLFAVAIAPERYTFKLVEEYGEFGLNFLPINETEKVYRTGYTSGREVDKFTEFSLTRVKAKRIKAPLIGEALTALECKVVNRIETGDHYLFIGKVVETWIDPEKVSGEGKIDLKSTSPVYHIGGKRFAGIDPKSIVEFQ